MLVAVQTEDRHGIFDPHIFRVELERAFTAALQRSRAAQTRSERRARRTASRASAPVASVERHRLQGSPSLELADWYSDAPRATGEDQLTFADEADPDLRLAATLAAERATVETIERLTGFTFEEADAVAFRTQDAIGRDEDNLSWLQRDEAPAPHGFGMTDQEIRRAFVQNARLRYRDQLGEALVRHRGRVSAQQANEFPALRAEVQRVRSIQARWRFVDELARHGVTAEGELVRKLKSALAPTYEQASAKLAARRRLGLAGRVDRFRHELLA